MILAQFTIPGKIRGKSRPRAFRRGGFIRIHPTDQDISYENWVRTCYLNEFDQKPHSGALSVEIEVSMPIPKSYSVKKRNQALSGEIRPTKKPDNDNIEKIICDSLNKIAYNDDKQIVESTCIKIFGEKEGVFVTIRKIAEES